MESIEDFIARVPKAELHLHIEGSLEPELVLELVRRNNVGIKYRSLEEIRRAYRFENLQDFLNIYYRGMDTLRTEEDFYELTVRYFQRAHRDNVVHAEIFFDSQEHLRRGLKFETVVDGILEGMKYARDKYGITSHLILSLLRDLPEENGMRILDFATPYLDKIIAVGLDSTEMGNPPSKFARAFEKARDMGLLRVAHAGEEGAPEYIWEAIKILDVHRIDHGVRAREDSELMDTLAKERIPLTMCPLSNLKLKVVGDLRDYPLVDFLRRGIVATINSDDPAYFGGYVNDNYLAVHRALGLKHRDICTLAKNSIDASFIDSERKMEIFEKIDEICGPYL